MAAQKELERSKLEVCGSDDIDVARTPNTVSQDSLNDKIKNRPAVSELIKEGILNGEP
jgi:hypothetical protein